MVNKRGRFIQKLRATGLRVESRGLNAGKRFCFSSIPNFGGMVSKFLLSSSFEGKYDSDLIINNKPVIILKLHLRTIQMYRNLTLIKNKLMKSKATILTPREPLNFDKSEILDIRITTAASGKGENAIRRLKYF